MVSSPDATADSCYEVFRNPLFGRRFVGIIFDADVDRTTCCGCERDAAVCQSLPIRCGSGDLPKRFLLKLVMLSTHTRRLRAKSLECQLAQVLLPVNWAVQN